MGAFFLAAHSYNSTGTRSLQATLTHRLLWNLWAAGSLAVIATSRFVMPAPSPSTFERIITTFIHQRERFLATDAPIGMLLHQLPIILRYNVISKGVGFLVNAALAKIRAVLSCSTCQRATFCLKKCCSFRILYCPVSTVVAERTLYAGFRSEAA